MRTLVALSLLVVMTAGSAQALAADTAVQQLTKRLASLIPDRTPDSVQQTPIAGLYVATYGPHVYYLSADARYFIRGDLIDLKSQVNLTEKRKEAGRLKVINAIPTSDMIIYKPKGKVKHTVTVFTDIDCPYCRKLHSGMKQMNAEGIEVRYLAFPRTGIGSPSYVKAEKVWCATDRNAAMDAAKAGEPIKGKTDCHSPVREEYLLGQSLGVTGTPAMIFDDGRMVPGYLPPDQLLSALEGKG